MLQYYNGTMAQWYSDTMILKYNDTMVLRYSDTIELWYRIGDMKKGKKDCCHKDNICPCDPKFAPKFRFYGQIGVVAHPYSKTA